MCKGVNDGEELKRSIEDLTKYIPCMQSVSVVPVGLSKYRDGLYPLEPFTKEDACQVIDLIEMWQKKLYKEHGIHFIHASDEWYILAERPLPEEERYDGYIQLENGVGMLRLLASEVEEALKGYSDDGQNRTVSIATGRLPYPYIKKYAGWINEKFPGRTIHIYPIRNDFFGRIHHCIRPSHRAGCDRPAKGQRAGRIPSSSGKYVPQRRDRFFGMISRPRTQKRLYK